MQLQNLENKLVGKILAFKSYFMNEILSLKDQIKDYKINGNVQELSIEKSEDLIWLRERVKYLESENTFLKDEIFNKQKLIDKLAMCSVQWQCAGALYWKIRRLNMTERKS